MKLLVTRWKAVAGVPFLLFFLACGNQGEGERCDKLNNQNGDCEGSLVCTSFTTSSDLIYQVCCPPPPATSTAEACIFGATGGGGPSTGDTDAGAADAAGSSTDSGAE